MTKNKNKSSVVKAIKDGEIIYLSARDETKGVDIKLDLQGYKIEAI